MFDIVAALLLLLVLSPLLLIVAASVRVTLGTPIFFRQQRPGLHGKPFTLIKFRSMTSDRDPAGNLLPDRDRLTRFGRLLRKSSIDELPELWNVLKGDMSLVGPRPLLMEYLDRYTPEQNRRHCVRPGIAGLAQVRGRNAILFSQRLRYDVEYVDNYSFRLDCSILLRTLYLVAFGKLFDGAGQDVAAVDDIGLHPDLCMPSRSSGYRSGNPVDGTSRSG